MNLKYSIYKLLAITTGLAIALGAGRMLGLKVIIDLLLVGVVFAPIALFLWLVFQQRLTVPQRALVLTASLFLTAICFVVTLHLNGRLSSRMMLVGSSLWALQLIGILWVCHGWYGGQKSASQKAVSRR